MQTLELNAATKNTKRMILEFSKMKILSNSFCEIDNTTITMSKKAFTDLLHMVGLTNKSVTFINNEVNDDAGYQIMRELMKALAARKRMKVAVYINELSREIVRFSPEDESLLPGAPIPSKQMQSMLESLLGINGITLADSFIGDGGTTATFNINYEQSIPLIMKGEDITIGKQIKWDMFGETKVSDFVQRQVCTNGMTRVMPSRASYSLTNESAPSEWYTQLHRDLMAPNKEILNHYQERVIQAMQTNLSVHEYNSIAGHMISNWAMDMPLITKFIGDGSWKTEYERKSIDLNKLSAAQLRNCPTPVNAWDAINCMTDLASHTYNSSVGSAVKMQTQNLAGNMLNKKWDEEQQIMHVPTFKKDSNLIDITAFN